ncbi:BA75_04587T0 [Komagataella pastoris]|uniref:25S rRNA adenine-N(1) methyltransferase n=1 Tax=Komagataella pastoris TaxID=4922 RepID=A0A1B2JIK8_PICPA|nr:BA75_04587T0 [Komagataella pastoris]
MKRKSLKAITKETKTVHVPSSIKPQRARQLIRRFHLLLKNKTLALQKLQSSEADYLTKLKQIGTFQVYSGNRQKVVDSIKVNSLETENVIKIESLEPMFLSGLLGRIDGEIFKRGGLDAYQVASTQGQNGKRGGDSSKYLIKWLSELELFSKVGIKPNALEIGCLSSQNLISTSKVFEEVVRIDLQSQESKILKQDFMQRPLPKNDTEKFNLISCSLVLNFVPTASDRGQMLKRVTTFLKETHSYFFLVLPLPCITNSRYCTQEHVAKLMSSLGFQELKFYQAQKIAYWLYKWNGSKSLTGKTFLKKELVSGKGMNNFCIVLD